MGFTGLFEGVVPWMYNDVKGLVTVGIGNLVDPIQFALPLPFMRPDGSPASRDEIAAEWLRVKNDPDAARLGHLSTKAITRLRLTGEGVADLAARKLAQNERHLIGRFPAFEAWPADAQLATLSMAWACGPAFRFPLLEAALRKQDWHLASVECHIDDRGNPGVTPRNHANRACYRNAGLAEDPDVLYWPRDLAAEPDTIPEVRLDLLESEPPPALVSERMLYVVPDPPKHEPAVYDDGWKDPDDEPPDAA